MNTIADLKRALTPGTTVHVENYETSALTGTRTVLTVQSQRLELSLPEAHPDHGSRHGSWLSWPKRGFVRFEGDSVVLLADWPGTSRHGQPWCKITL